MSLKWDHREIMSKWQAADSQMMWWWATMSVVVYSCINYRWANQAIYTAINNNKKVKSREHFHARKPSPPILPDPVVPVLSVAKPSLEKPDNFKNNKFEIPTDENVPWTLPFVVVYSCINYRWANQALD